MKRGAALCAAAGLALAAACCACVPASAAASSPGSASGRGAYVALGDSYTAGPVIPPASPTASPLCDQSAANYPHLTAKALGLSLADVSCGGAEVSDMTRSQHPGVPPQFDALSARDTVVTLGIGGNDDNTFITAVAGCGLLGAADPANKGAPCEKVFGNRFADNIASDAPNIGAALDRIHVLAPRARVYVVGYPDILPQHGSCWPRMPMTTGDVAYLNGVERDLNGMLEREADENGATFVDTYEPSVGHDACQPESARWIEPAVPSSPAAFVHPNAAGEAAMASVVERAVK